MSVASDLWNAVEHPRGLVCRGHGERRRRFLRGQPPCALVWATVDGTDRTGLWPTDSGALGPTSPSLLASKATELAVDTRARTPIPSCTGAPSVNT